MTCFFFFPESLLATKEALPKKHVHKLQQSDLAFLAWLCLNNGEKTSG
jgi:hypothetical protein